MSGVLPEPPVERLPMLLHDSEGAGIGSQATIQSAVRGVRGRRHREVPAAKAEDASCGPFGAGPGWRPTAPRASDGRCRISCMSLEWSAGRSGLLLEDLTGSHPHLFGALPVHR